MKQIYLWVLSAVLVLGALLPQRVLSQTLTLEEALRIAQENAPTARIAQERSAQSAARVRMAESAFYPQLGISSSYVSSDNPVQAFMFALNQGKFSMQADVNNPPRADNWLLSGQVGLRVFSGGSDMANRQAANSARIGLENMELATRNEVSLQVLQAYLSVLTAEQFVRAAETAVKAFETAEGVISSRVAAGTALKTDLLNIQVQRIQAEEQKLRAGNALLLAKEGLKFALGVETLPYTEFSSLERVGIKEAPSESKGLRPELTASDAFAQAARAQLKAAKGSYLPSINAFASIDRYQGWEFDGTNDNWTIGVNAQWSIFDGFLTRSKVREKRAALNIAEEEARMTKLRTSLELESARSSMLEATKRVAVMTQATELASESATLTRQRFDQGLMLTSQVIDAENALVQAEVGLAQAKADRLFAIASLRRALNLPIVGE
ncbi:MAG: TolC family protein [bacterium]|nr:TolC family protein [bacterium]